jgi:hypothetical protein
MTKRIQMYGKAASGMRVARVALLLIGGIALTACPKAPNVPDFPVPPACEINNTATVSFTNTAGGTATLYVDFDGANLTGNIADGVTSSIHTVSAGTHSIIFRNASGGAAVCATINPNLQRCTSNSYACS